MCNVFVPIYVLQTSEMELHSRREQSRRPVAEAADMGEENSHNKSKESESAYENKKGVNRTSSPSVSLEEEEGRSSSGNLGGDTIEE